MPCVYFIGNLRSQVLIDMSDAYFLLNVIAFIKCRYRYLDFISIFIVSDSSKPLKPIALL